jgi:hypothetical protein
MTPSENKAKPVEISKKKLNPQKKYPGVELLNLLLRYLYSKLVDSCVCEGAVRWLASVFGLKHEHLLLN